MVRTSNLRKQGSKVRNVGRVEKTTGDRNLVFLSEGTRICCGSTDGSEKIERDCGRGDVAEKVEVRIASVAQSNKEVAAQEDQ